MIDQQKIRAMIESMVSVFISVHAHRYGNEIDKGDEDVRANVRCLIEEAIEKYKIDETCWNRIKGTMLYDVYLDMRRNEGTITKFDLVRPGLTMGMFADANEYVLHAQRVSNQSASGINNKICSRCGESKDMSKFKKRGGGVCNACRSRDYRNRKKREAAK